MNTAERIRLPDDCTIGYIVEALLGEPLIRSGLFHSHLENLQQVLTSELHEQVHHPPGPARTRSTGRDAWLPRGAQWVGVLFQTGRPGSASLSAGGSFLP